MRWLVSLFFVVGALIAGADARADAQADALARDAYDRGAAAYEAKDFPRAATLFAHADDLVPNPMVLKLGLAAVLQTSDPVLGMTLVLRAEARAVDGSLAELAREVRARFEGKVGTVRVVCRARAGCRARIGDETFGDDQLAVAMPGDVDVVFEGDRPVHVPVKVRVREIARAVEPEPPSKPAPEAPAPVQAAPPPSAEGSGLPRGVFWGGVALTAVLGGLTVASGLDTAHQHTVFLRNPTPDGKDRGQSGETRTNIGLGASLAVAAATAIVGLFFTNWKGAPGTVAF